MPGDDAILELRNQIGQLRTQISSLGGDIRKLVAPTDDLARKAKGAFGLARAEASGLGQGLAKVGGPLGAVLGKLGPLTGMAPGIGAIGAGFAIAGLAARAFVAIMERQRDVLEKNLELQKELAQAETRAASTQKAQAAAGRAQAEDRATVDAFVGRPGLEAMDALEKTGQSPAAAAAAILAANRASRGREGLREMILYAARLLHDTGATRDIGEATNAILGTGVMPSNPLQATQAARLAFGAQRGFALRSNEDLPGDITRRNQLVASDRSDRRTRSSILQAQRDQAIERGTVDARAEALAAENPLLVEQIKVQNDQLAEIQKLARLAEEESTLMRLWKQSWISGDRSDRQKYQDALDAKAAAERERGGLIPPNAGQRP